MSVLYVKPHFAYTSELEWYSPSRRSPFAPVVRCPLEPSGADITGRRIFLDFECSKVTLSQNTLHHKNTSSSKIKSQDAHKHGKPNNPTMIGGLYLHLFQLLAVTGMTLLPSMTFAVTPPSTCQYKVFVDGYPNPGCVVPNTGPVMVNLADSLFLAPGDCKDTREPLLSFRDAISNDAKATTCTLTAYSLNGCMGTAFAVQPNVEANENQCVDYSLKGGAVTGAKSFGLRCT